MNDLIIHVERIVRPVRAMQFRKLRMRRELLTHLQAAFDEERSNGVPEPAAMENAKRRLGDPPELTRSLQQTVPLIDRLCLARAKLPGGIEQWRMETRSTWLYGPEQPMQRLTMLHAGLLFGAAAALSCQAIVIAALAGRPAEFREAVVERMTAFVMLNVINCVAMFLLYVACVRFIAGVAAPISRMTFGRWGRFAALIVGAPLAERFASVTIIRRAPQPTDLVIGMGIGLALFVALTLIGLLIRRLRARYDQWLALEVED